MSTPEGVPDVQGWALVVVLPGELLVVEAVRVLLVEERRRRYLSCH